MSSVTTPLQQVPSNGSIFHGGKHPVRTDVMYDDVALHPNLVPLKLSSSLMPLPSLSLSVVWQSICLQHPPHVRQRRQANRLHPLQLHEGDFIKPTEPRGLPWWVDGCWIKPLPTWWATQRPWSGFLVKVRYIEAVTQLIVGIACKL